MKRILSILAAALLVSIQYISALEPEAERFRSDIKSFLREEGFSPYIDDDESLCFKKEGLLYWMFFSGSRPVYIGLYRTGTDCEDSDIPRLLKAVNETNFENRCVKAMINSDNTMVCYTVQSYCYAPEDFKYAFYKYMSALDGAKESIVEKYNSSDSKSSASSLPIKFNSASVRNEDNEGTAISDWGANIYAYRTKYLTPKINVNVSTPGSYDIYVKMFNADGNLTTSDHSPAGYSYKCSKYFGEGNREVKLTGWGSDKSGHWKAGNYRFEFYLNDRLLGSKSFTVK